ncbi:MAG: endo alpha-1,4 polygalactosaminidase [Candidatus Heimdallarchaeum endolithica]|uniref:Endo alpha-1,4 polygalactosaminidase n=1 Tax=Candidatus Heimdallarchaeum endolithica TaxID=2876572 RepID=A0A9Y1BS09_9ARCH|nr:MAG: endo alpha-1,4 polygalactosaminidase [Candidatus Heimdallarchaeum endolithica]
MKKSLILLTVLIVSLLLVTGLYFYFFYVPNIEPQTPPQFSVNGFIVNDFAYQLQNIDIDEISNSKYDLIIIDYSADGSEELEYNFSQVTYMREGNERKILLSYMSIGEAETYRFYWDNNWDADNDGVPDDNAPEWLDIENPDWEGNYKVKYWNLDWQKIIFGTNESYLDRIIAAGFDGCYLDIIDAFEYYEEERPTAKEEMIDFVISLSDYAKSKKQGFLVIPQNGELLLENDSYREAIDGIGREDLYFLNNIRRPEKVIGEVISLLKLLTKENKIVMIIDYPTLYSKVQVFYPLAYQDGFIAHAPPRDLDELVYYPDFLPD